MSREDRDPYVTLGVHRQASASDIGRAYRSAARATHPDIRPGDPSAPARFRAVTAAYELLSDPGRRARYDRAHPVALRVSERPGEHPDPPLGHRPPFWVDAVHVGGSRRAAPLAVEDELFELAAALRRSLRAGWFLRYHG